MNGSGDFFHHAFLLIGEEVLLVYAADRILQLGDLLIAGFAFRDEFLLGDRAGYAQVNQLRARVKEADRTAINATCELYALTPEMLSAFLRTKFGTQDNAPEIPAAPQLPEGENE